MHGCSWEISGCTVWLESIVFSDWQALRDLGQARLEEVDAVAAEYLGGRSKLEAIDAIELRRRLEDVVVLDVRASSEYEAGHIQGARNVPHNELEARLRVLPANTEIVAYCVLADEIVAALRAKGFRALRLTEGFPDWHLRGFPVAMGVEQTPVIQ